MIFIFNIEIKNISIGENSTSKYLIVSFFVVEIHRLTDGVLVKVEGADDSICFGNN